MSSVDIKKVLIFDQGNPVTDELVAKAYEIFQDRGKGQPEYIVLKLHRKHGIALEALKKTIEEERPELVLIGATALGEEVAPALGILFETGVAAHCVDMKISPEGQPVFMVPAFGGKVIGEILIPGFSSERPAIGTVKPGILGSCDVPEGFCQRIVDGDSLEIQGEGFVLVEKTPREHSSGSIESANLVLCAGFGTEDEEYREKLQLLAERLGGSLGCTRAALDAGWGYREETMIGTSGRSIKPKLYIGFGISGAAHHLCGIKDAETIISINKDSKAEIFQASDYSGVFDARDVIDMLMEETEV